MFDKYHVNHTAAFMVMMRRMFHVHYHSLLFTGLAGLIRVSYYYPGNNAHSLTDDSMKDWRVIQRQYLLANCIFSALLVGSMVLVPLLEHRILPCYESCGKLRLTTT